MRRENQHSGQNNCNLKQKVPGARQCPDAALRAPGGSGRRRGARSPEREMQAGAGQARGGGLGVHSETSEEPLKMSGAVTVSELPWQPHPQRAQGWSPGRREELLLSSGACFCSHSPLLHVPRQGSKLCLSISKAHTSECKEPVFPLAQSQSVTKIGEDLSAFREWSG